MADDLAGRGDAELEQALVDLGTKMPQLPTSDLSGAVLERIAAGGPPPDQPSSWSLGSLQGPLGLAFLVLVVAAVGVVQLSPAVPATLVDRLGLRTSPTARPTDDPMARGKVVVYGGDLTEAERQELAGLFGADQPATTDTVTGEELAAALRAAGLPAAPSDKAISSAALMCLGKGEGLRVRTRHVTRIPAAAYANALLTAGVVDGSVVIAAPSMNPVSGETALVGVLKAFPHCQGGQQPEPARVRLAYEQLRATAALAGETEDLTRASAVMLRATQAVVTGQAKDEASIGATVDVTAAGEGMAMSPAHRSELVSFLGRLRDLDYGPYAKGYRIEQLAPNDVSFVRVGADETSNAAGLARVAR